MSLETRISALATAVGEDIRLLYAQQASGGGIGVGQSWQDLSASRVIGTTYTNTTGRTIAVSFVPVAASLKTHSLVVDDAVVAALSYGSATIKAQLFALVPPGSTYKVNSTSTIETWMELR